MRAAIFLASVLYIQSASAFNQPWQGVFNGPASGIGKNQQMADDFSFTADTAVNRVTFYGMSVGGDLPHDQGLDFLIRFYEDDPAPPLQSANGSRPQLSPFYETQVSVPGFLTGDSSETYAGITGPLREILVFTAQVPQVTFDAGSTYWFSVGFLSDSFIWAQSDTSRDLVVFRPGGFGEGSPWYRNVNGDAGNLSFSLDSGLVPPWTPPSGGGNGNGQNGGPQSVPENSTSAPLLALGIAMMVLVRPKVDTYFTQYLKPTAR